MALEDWMLEASEEKQEESFMYCKHLIGHWYKGSFYCSHCGMVLKDESQIIEAMNDGEILHLIERGHGKLFYAAWDKTFPAGAVCKQCKDELER